MDDFKHYIKIKFNKISLVNAESESEAETEPETIKLKKDSNFFFIQLIKILYTDKISEKDMKEINKEILFEINNIVYNFLNNKDNIYWKENIFHMSSWNQWNIYKENKESSIPIIKNHICNAIKNMINTYPTLLITKKNIQKDPDFDLLRKLQNKNNLSIFSTICQENLQRILCLLEMIPIDFFCEELYSFCWLSVFLIFLEKKTCIDEIQKDEIIIIHEFQKEMIPILFSFLHIETNNRILIDVCTTEN